MLHDVGSPTASEDLAPSSLKYECSQEEIRDGCDEPLLNDTP